MTGEFTRWPVLLTDVECRVVRQLEAPEFHVGVGQLVEPDTPLATVSVGTSRTAQIAVAAELGVPPNEVARCLVRPLGERVEAGEVIAARRRGLRELRVTTPIAGELVRIDELTGTVAVVAPAPRQTVLSVIAGEIVSLAEQAAEIRVVGDVIAGAALLGPECGGPLVVLADRPDRELPPEEVDERCQGAVVVAGMTVSGAVLRRLSDVGAAGLIVGSLSLAELAPFFTGSLMSSLNQVLRGALGAWPLPFGVLLLNGFGRLPIPAPLLPVFEERRGRGVALLNRTSVGLEWPVCLTFSRSLQGRAPIPVRLVPRLAIQVRLPARPGIGKLLSGPFWPREMPWNGYPAVLVERDGERELLPLDAVVPLSQPAEG